jgi:hypothetical protein
LRGVQEKPTFYREMAQLLAWFSFFVML